MKTSSSKQHISVEVSTSSSAQLVTQTNRDIVARWLQIGFWVMGTVLGFCHAWANHHYLVNSDAMSYLDIAEAYLRGDWQAAINSYWSPLYSWLIAVAFWIVRPSPYWKFSVLHMVNYAIYLFALGCFAFFIGELAKFHRGLRETLHARKLVNLPTWAWFALGYPLFIWSALYLVRISEESPDLLVAAFVYLTCGILTRLRRKPATLPPFIFLGIVLGIGYLAKTVMLPLSFVFMLASILGVGSLRKSLGRVLVAFATFLLVVSPFIIAISHAKGRFTFGDSGKLNYLWSINGVVVPHWQGEEPGYGMPKHATRRILAFPEVYEFAGRPGTYPVWYDPVYWYEGSISHFDFGGQSKIILKSFMAFYDLFSKWGLQYGLLVGLLFLYLWSERYRKLVDDLAPFWYLLIPTLAGIGIYFLVNVQGRYIASFLVLLWLIFFSAVRLNDSEDSQRLIANMTIIIMVVMSGTILASSSAEARLTARYLVNGENSSAHEQWLVAEGLRQMGLEQGDNVAFIGKSTRAFWAYLAGLRIIAEIDVRSVDDFWVADRSARKEVLKAFATTGAKAVVTEKPPNHGDVGDFLKIGNTDYYAYMLR